MGACRAVKVVFRQSFDNDRPFEREFHGIEKFEPISRSHESQVNILHVGRGEGYFYYVMELADDGNDERGGRSADFDRRVLMSAATYTPKTLKSEKQRRGRLPFSECLEIGLSLTTALAHLHKHGLVHRDIKPSNIIFVNGIPKLADIGLVTGSDVTGSFVGTEGFIPPEGPGSAQADIFALGKVLYEISSGKDRHEFPEPPTHLGEFADREDLLELDEVIQHACARDTARRYATAEAMEADLLLLKTGRSVRQTHVLARRLTVATRVGVTAMVIALLAVGAYFTAQNQARRARETSEREARLRLQTEQQRSHADALAERMRQDLYVADVQLAQSRLRDGDFGDAARTLLADVPHPGQADLRGFEWSYFWKQAQGNKLFAWRAHERAILWLDVAPDGKFIASASEGGEVKVWDGATYRLLSVLTNADAAAFSPDGQRLFTTFSRGGQVDIWKTGSWERLGGFPADSQRASHQEYPQIAISPGEPILAVARGCENKWGGSGSVQLYNYLTLEQLATLKDCGDRMCFSRDGRTLATGSYHGKIYLWDVATRKRKCRLAPVQDVTSLALSGDGQWLATAERGLTLVRLRDIALQKTFYLRHQSVLWKVLFSPDGKTLATTTTDKTIRLWDAETQQQRVALNGQGGEIWALAFSPRGDCLLSGGVNGEITVWPTQPPHAPVPPILRDAQRGNRPRFSPDSQTLAVFDEGAVRLWNIDSWKQTGTLPGARCSLWFAPDGKTLLALGTNEWLQFWDLPSQSVRRSVRLASAEVLFTRIAASADGKLLATISAAEPRQVALWDTTSGQPGGSMTGKVRGSNADDGTLALSPDGRFLANCGDGVDVWDLRTRERYWAFSPHRSTVNQLVFAPDKDTFATCSADGTVKLWSLAGRREVATFTQDAEVRDIAFSPDGRTLASAGKDGLLKLWNLSTDREIATIKTGAVLAFLEFSPDNRCLAYGDWRGLLMFRSASPAEIDDRRATANRIAAGEGLPARLAFAVPDLAAGLSLALPKSP